MSTLPRLDSSPASSALADGPRFLLDAAPIGHAQDLLQFPPDTVPSGLHVASPSTTNRSSHLFRQSALEYILAFEALSSFVLFSTRLSLSEHLRHVPPLSLLEARSSFILFSTSSAFKPGAKTLTHPVPPSLHHAPPPRPELVTYAFRIHNSSHVPSGLHVASPSTTNRPSHLFRQSALEYIYSHLRRFPPLSYSRHRRNSALALIAL